MLDKKLLHIKKNFVPILNRSSRIFRRSNSNHNHGHHNKEQGHNKTYSVNSKITNGVVTVYCEGVGNYGTAIGAKWNLKNNKH